MRTVFDLLIMVLPFNQSVMKPEFGNQNQIELLELLRYSQLPVRDSHCCDCEHCEYDEFSQCPHCDEETYEESFDVKYFNRTVSECLGCKKLSFYCEYDREQLERKITTLTNKEDARQGLKKVHR